MKVWELIAELSKCPAGANVNVGISQTLNAPANQFECEDGEVNIRSTEDVEVCDDDGNTRWLSSLLSSEED